jgi:thymidine kinase
MYDLSAIYGILALGAWILWALYYIFLIFKTKSKIIRCSPSPNLKLTSILRSRSEPNKSVGSLHCIVGPMFSGKTSAMITQVVRYADITLSSSPLIINHNIDKGRVVGNGNTKLGVSSHSSQMKGISDRVRTIYTEKLSDVDVSQYNVIGIDEASHYSDLYDTVVEWLSQGKHIYCAGLDGNSQATNFGEIHKLLPKSDTFTKITAVCYFCKKEYENTGCVVTPDSFVAAPFTIKIGGDMKLEVEQGGQEKYLPVCRYHFLNFEV